MTERGRAVAALGLVVYLAAWIFGSHALYPVAVGLLLAVVVAVAWVRLSSRPPHVRRHGASRDVIEGDDIRIDLEVEPTARSRHRRSSRTSVRAGSASAAFSCIVSSTGASRAATNCALCRAAATRSTPCG
jgi:hypothetical protein